jgi:hypothetical protein
MERILLGVMNTTQLKPNESAYTSREEHLPQTPLWTKRRKNHFDAHCWQSLPPEKHHLNLSMFFDSFPFLRCLQISFHGCDLLSF